MLNTDRVIMDETILRNLNQNPQYSQRNFYNGMFYDPVQGLRYRLDGDEIVKRTIERLRGYRENTDGKMQYMEKYRMLNEDGIARTEAFLMAAINKNNHLTKYENETRVLLQVKEMIKSYTTELVLNLKKWAPQGSFKVQNWRLIVQIVENAILQSMQRAVNGFEADNLTKQHTINENVSNDNNQLKPRFPLSLLYKRSQ